MRQRDLDNEMIELGKDRYWSKVNRGIRDEMETYSPVAKRLLGESIIKLQESIDFWCHNAKTGAGRRHRCLEYIELLPSDLVAALTARTVLDGISMRRTITSISVRLGQYLEDEYRFRKIQDEQPLFWKSLFDRTKKHGGYVARRRFIHKSAKAADIVLPRWTGKVVCAVGLVLVELMQQATGLIEIRTVTSVFNRSTTLVMPTDELLFWIKKAHAHHEILSPVLMPTIEKPLQWQSIYIGGYHSDQVRRRPLVKTYDRTFLEQLNNTNMPQFYEAIGHMQNTSWEINSDVYECLKYAYENNHEIGDLPRNEDTALPERPNDMDWEDPVIQKQWRRQAAEVHNMNHRDRSKRLQLSKILFLANKFSEEKFYYPCACDFRGRVYPAPNYMHYQGASFTKALLRFSEGVPLETQEDVNWLAVQAANTWGHDKKSFDYRIKWVWENEDLFKSIAQDPLGYTQWKDADSPFEFLAAATEIGEFLDQGYGYMSRVPVAQDASNQGLQLYSLLLRDPEAAHYTNVLGGDEPQDLYKEVALRVVQKLEVSDHEYAKRWLNFGINRSTTKRQTMVLCYGSTKQSCKEYTLEWFNEMLMRRGMKNPFDEVYKPCIFLSDMIWDSISDVVTSAKLGMDWLRDIARVCMANKVNPMWSTPTNFMVKQLYEKQASYEVKTSIGDKIRRHRLQFGKGEAAPRKNINGICPNFIHSLDAALMMRTTNRAAKRGVTQFAMVHDSYGVPASQVPIINEAVRHCTVEMFSDDLLEGFKNEIEYQLPKGVELPEVPERGTLDIKCVLDSKYYFA